jgi:ABC-2 type transport system permease protein
MKKTLLVLKYELTTLLKKPGFLIIAFGFPLIGVLVLSGINLINSGSGSESETDSAAEELQIEGFIDHSGLIKALPDDLPRGTLVKFANEELAAAALADDQIAAYYVVPSDHVETGELIYVHPSLNPLTDDRQDWILRQAIVFNLVGRDASAMERLFNPLELEETNLSAIGSGTEGDCARPGMDCDANPLIGLIPTIVMVFFFIAFTNGSALLIRSISEEKQNRLIEILASSVDPLHLMAGKILGMGIGTLMAFAMWVIAAFAALRLSQPNLPVEFEIPGSLLPWAIVFFLLGFTFYASLMAGVGALVPNIKDTTKVSWLVIGPMMVGYLIGIFSMERPHNPLITALSLFPVTSPLNMVQRLTTGEVPGWQPVAAAVLLMIAVFLALRTAARLFRAHNLLSGQPFSPKVLIRALKD